MSVKVLAKHSTPQDHKQQASRRSDQTVMVQSSREAAGEGSQAGGCPFMVCSMRVETVARGRMARGTRPHNLKPLWETILLVTGSDQTLCLNAAETGVNSEERQTAGCNSCRRSDRTICPLPRLMLDRLYCTSNLTWRY